MKNKITVRMALEIIHHEAVIRRAYKDSVGVWTWSVGLTNATGHNVERYVDNPQSMRRCLEVYLWALEKYADDVREVFKDHPLTEAEFTAALSFHWNTGGIRKASWVRHFKKGRPEAARKSFMKWRRPKEIIPRRRAEANLLFDGKWVGDGKITEYTKLTRKYQPVWRSAIRLDVSDEIHDILDPATAGPETPEVDDLEKREASIEPTSGSLVRLLFNIVKAFLP